MRPRRVVVASLIAALLVLAVAYFVGPPFFHLTFSQFLATVAGLLIGIPVALYMLSVGQQSERRASVAAAREKKCEVLVAVHAELCENLDDLAARRTEAGTRMVRLPALSIEVWEAVKASGELQYVADAELLRVMARAYRFLGQTRFIEENFARRYGHAELNPELSRGVIATDTVTKAALDKAVAAIEREDPGIQKCGPVRAPVSDS